MTSSSTLYACSILRQILVKITPGFSGIGIVFYQDLNQTPHADLGHPSAARPSLPVTGEDEISTTLARVSHCSSPWHDGFHFVCSHPLSLTHVAQFISPNLAQFGSIPTKARPSGARHTTAIIVSSTPGIDCVGLLTTNRELVVFEGGLIRAQEILL